MGYTRSSASYYGFFGILAVTVYAVTFLAASDYIGTWTAGVSHTSELLAEDIYRAGLVSAGALGAIFGLGFASRRRGPADLAGCVLSVFAGIMLAAIGLEGTGAGEDFFPVFASMMVLAALSDAVGRAAVRDHLPSATSAVLALLMASAYHYGILHGLGFITASAVWVLSASIFMAYGHGRDVRDAEGMDEGGGKGDGMQEERVASSGPVFGEVTPSSTAFEVQEGVTEASAHMPEGPSEEPCQKTSPVGHGDVMRDAGTKFLAEIPDPRDIYTDNSPEALVRRAAFNKGLRYRRNYGGHGIQVAFVAHRVAVFVQPQDYDDSVDDALRSEGWTVLRYSEESITDGSVQGEEILATVRQAEKQRARQKGKSAS